MLRIKRGFSLVELMITVAIIGLLAAIAIPNMTEMALRAKRAEVLPMCNAIADAAAMYIQDAPFDIWTDANPDWNPGKEQRAWDPDKFGWAEFGWEPDGEIRCSYLMGSWGGGWGWPPEVYAYAYCDLDADWNWYGYEIWRQLDVGGETWTWEWPDAQTY